MKARNDWKWMMGSLLLGTLFASGMIPANAEENAEGTWETKNIVVGSDNDNTGTYYGGLFSGQNMTGWTKGEDYTLSGSQEFKDAEISVGKGTEGTESFTNARLIGTALNGNTLVLTGDANTPITFSGNNITSYRENSNINSLGIGGGLVYGGNSMNLSNVVFDRNTTTITGGYVIGGVAGCYLNKASGLHNVAVTNNTANGLVAAGAVAAMSGDDNTATSGRYFALTGTTTFDANTSTGTAATGTISDGQTRYAVEGGALHVEANMYLGGLDGNGGATLTFSNNEAKATTDNSGVAGGAVFANRSTYVNTDNNEITFSGNKATGNATAYGGGLYAGRSSVNEGTTGYEINFGGTGNTITFENNSATAADARGGAIAALKQGSIPVDVKFSGSNNTVTFTGNSATGTNSKGGAIYTDSNVIFSGTNNTVTFSGNTAAEGNDIYAGGSVSISGTGTYVFDGGITANTLSIDGANVTFEAGSISSVNSLSLNNATLNMKLSDASSFHTGSLSLTGENQVYVYSSLTLAGTQQLFANDGTEDWSGYGENWKVFMPENSNLIGIVTTDAGNLVVEAKTVEKGKIYDATTGEVVTGSLSDVKASANILIPENQTAVAINIEGRSETNLTLQSNDTTVKTIASEDVAIDTNGSSLTLNLDNIQFNGKAINAGAGNVVITGTNAAFIHTGEDIQENAVITAKSIKLAGGNFTIGSIMVGDTTIGDEVEGITHLTVGASSSAATDYEIVGNFSTEAAQINLDILSETSTDKLTITGTTTFGENTVFHFSSENYDVKLGDSFTILTSKGLIQGIENLIGTGAWGDRWAFNVSGNETEGYSLVATAAIPEPASWLMLLLGFLGLRFIRKR
ncbi:MAG: hypothetical protein Q4D98_00225 [Planctomycetia bacterium]|nr:hypothetical protein [Planctomycetia bacterium]